MGRHHWAASAARHRGGATQTVPVLETGVVGWTDQATANEIGSGNLGATVMRAEFTVGTSVAAVAQVVDYCAAAHLRLQPLVGWDDGTPCPDLTGLAAWATALGPGGTHWGGGDDTYAIRSIELGNENAMYYKSGLPGDAGYQSLATTYGQRALAAAQAIHAANPAVGVLVELWGGDSNQSMWIDKTLAAGGATLVSLMHGPTIHPYGPDWASRIDLNWGFLAPWGAQKPYYLTEWGISCDNGNTLSDNYGWPTNLTYAQAGADFTTAFGQFAANSKVAQVVIYGSHDTVDHGADNNREHFFGILTDNWADKGAISSACRAAFAQYRGGTTTVQVGTVTPTLTASELHSSDTMGAGATTSLATASFTPAAGELLVVKASSEGSLVTPNTPTGGGLTWTLRIDSNASGQCPARMWTARVGDTPAAMTVTVPFANADSAAGSGVFVLERWAHAQLATTPATAAAVTTTGESTITTTQNGSVVTWLDGDWYGAAGAPTYVGGATQTGLFHTDAQGITVYAAYQLAATAGAVTFGLSAPTGQHSTMAALELLPGLS